MISDTFEAIGTKWWIEIFDDVEEETGTVAIGDCARLAAEFNVAYSRFREDSEISKLNREREFINPSHEYRTLLNYGKNLYLRSNGHFNLLVGHVLEARGYDKEYSFTPDPAAKLPVCDPITDLIITDTKITLECGNVDLGGYGKGYLVDLMADLLQKHHQLKYFLINGGGDMYATSDRGTPIKIYLEHPTLPGKYIEETTLLNQGFAASSPFKRQWRHENKTYTHIVSKDTIEPKASFVKAATATEADAFGTVALLMNTEQVVTLAKHEQLAIARFDPTTNQIFKTAGFDTVVT